MPPPSSPLLPAASPAEWLARHVPAIRAGADARPGADWAAAADLPPRLASWHAQLVAGGEHPTAAALALVSVTAGAVAAAVGLGLAAAGAGVLIDGGSARWRLGAAGWPDGLALAPAAVLVPRGHAWAAQPGVAVADPEDVPARAVRALVAAVEPLVDAARRPGRVGARTAWGEVADALGGAAALRAGGAQDVPPDPSVAGVLAEASAVPGTPWRAAPRAWLAARPAGPAWVVRRGGCCLAWLRGHPGGRPAPAAIPCATCCLLTDAECERRQVGG